MFFRIHFFLVLFPTIPLLLTRLPLLASPSPSVLYLKHLHTVTSWSYFYTKMTSTRRIPCFLFFSFFFFPSVTMGNVAKKWTDLLLIRGEKYDSETNFCVLKVFSLPRCFLGKKWFISNRSKMTGLSRVWTGWNPFEYFLVLGWLPSRLSCVLSWPM